MTCVRLAAAQAESRGRARQLRRTSGRGRARTAGRGRCLGRIALQGLSTLSQNARPAKQIHHSGKYGGTISRGGSGLSWNVGFIVRAWLSFACGAAVIGPLSLRIRRASPRRRRARGHPGDGCRSSSHLIARDWAAPGCCPGGPIGRAGRAEGHWASGCARGSRRPASQNSTSSPSAPAGAKGGL